MICLVASIFCETRWNPATSKQKFFLAERYTIILVRVTSSNTIFISAGVYGALNENITWRCICVVKKTIKYLTTTRLADILTIITVDNISLTIYNVSPFITIGRSALPRPRRAPCSGPRIHFILRSKKGWRHPEEVTCVFRRACHKIFSRIYLLYTETNYFTKEGTKT